MEERNLDMDSISERISQLDITLRRSHSMEGSWTSRSTTRTILSSLFDQTRASGQEDLQMQFIDSITRYLLNLGTNGYERTPKPRQVQCIHRIVYSKGDTLLIAKTGYGKSIVLQAVSVIRNDKITIQVIPLSRLGEEQREVVARYPFANPVLIDQNATQDTRLWERLRQGEFTHVLLGPEQAMHPRFLKLLREATFNQQLAFIAIDEIHTVHQWREFRSSYADLHQLRTIIPKSIPWFGCTATLTAAGEEFVLRACGFGDEGTEPGNYRMIRTTVDRPDISIILQALEPGAMRDFRRLAFLFQGLHPGMTDVTDIPKTIVYMDSKPQLIKARVYLTNYLCKLGYGTTRASAIIQRYDADTRPTDQERLYTEFKKPNSSCRIVLATVSLGMGMDVPDVKRVVQYGELKSYDVADIWQRFGRANRNGCSQGKAFFFAPYWYFDLFGTEVRPQPNKKGGVQSRHRQPSGLRTEIRALDTASVASSQFTCSSFFPISVSGDQESQPAIEVELGIFGARQRRPWSKSNISRRTAFQREHPEMHAFVNAKCFRQIALDILQEPPNDKSPDADPAKCCNSCNHELGRLPPPPPKLQDSIKLRKNTQGWFICQEVREYCDGVAPTLYPDLEIRRSLPGEVFMTDKYTHPLSKHLVNYDINTREELIGTVPIFGEWDWLDTHVESLLEALPGLVEKGNRAWKQHREDTNDKHRKRQQPAGVERPLITATIPPATPNISFTTNTTLVPSSNVTPPAHTTGISVPPTTDGPDTPISGKRERPKGTGNRGRLRKKR